LYIGELKMDLKKVLVGIVVIIVAVVGGVKYYLQMKYSRSIDELASSMSPFARMTYSDVTTTFDGEIIVSGVNIEVLGETPENVAFREIRFKTPGFLYLLKDGSRMQAGEFPRKMNMSLSGLEFSTDGVFMQSLDNMVSIMNKQIAQYIETHCGEIEFLGPAQYKELGYENIISNFSMGYEFSDSDPSVHLTMNWQAVNMGSLDMSMELRGVVAPSVQTVMATGAPLLSNVSITYYDDTYIAKVTDYCSKKSNLTKAQYIEREANSDDKYYAIIWGFIPGQGIRDAYKQFLNDPQQIDAVLSPPSPIDITTIEKYSISDIPSLLGLRITVNGKNISDVNIKPAPSELANLGVQSFDSIVSGEQVAPVPEQNASAHEKGASAYHVVAIKDLGEFIGKPVRINVNTGDVREGWLTEVDKQRIVATKYVGGGELEYVIPIRNTSKVEVFYEKETETQ
jgi:hypothetical protein